MSTSPRKLLEHIRDEAEFLHTSMSGVSADEFARNAVLKRPCVRAIEVIGEAPKKVPEVFRARCLFRLSSHMANQRGANCGHRRGSLTRLGATHAHHKLSQTKHLTEGDKE
jgi:hypothetical protein